MTAAATQVLGIRDWTLNKKNRVAETTNSEGSGYATYIAGVDEADFTANAYWEDTQVPDTDITLDTGDSVAIVLEMGDMARSYSFTAIIESLTVTVNNQNGAIEYSVSGKATGAITDPLT